MLPYFYIRCLWTNDPETPLLTMHRIRRPRFPANYNRGIFQRSLCICVYFSHFMRMYTEMTVFLLLVRNLLSLSLSATLILHKGIEIFWQFNKALDNFWSYFTAHAQTWLFVSFRLQLWHRQWIQRSGLSTEEGYSSVQMTFSVVFFHYAAAKSVTINNVGLDKQNRG